MSPALSMPTEFMIPLNLLIWIIVIPIIIMGSMVLSSYMKKKVQPPYFTPRGWKKPDHVPSDSKEFLYDIFNTNAITYYSNS